METQFQNLTRAIDSQPMPPQFQDTKAMVSCNDCYAKSAVKYHWLGLKCAICDSYNTVQLSILTDPAVEVPSIESREIENTPAPEPMIGDLFLSTHLSPGNGPVRRRRHSSHAPTPLISPRYAPYPIPERIGRSVSPVRGTGFFDDAMVVDETEDSGGEDDGLDFWGRDGPRSSTSAENMAVEDEEEGSDSDSGSAMDDECDDGDENDEFELFGHR